MRIVFSCLIILFFMFCKSSKQETIFGVNPISGNKRILLGDFILKSNSSGNSSYGKFAKDIIAIELMKEGFHVEFLDSTYEYLSNKREESKIGNKNIILNAAGENQIKFLYFENLDSNIIAEIAKQKKFNLFLQGRIHLFKDEFRPNTPTELMANVLISNSDGELVAAFSSKTKSSSETTSDDLNKLIINIVSKINQVAQEK